MKYARSASWIARELAPERALAARVHGRELGQLLARGAARVDGRALLRHGLVLRGARGGVGLGVAGRQRDGRVLARRRRSDEALELDRAELERAVRVDGERARGGGRQRVPRVRDLVVERARDDAVVRVERVAERAHLDVERRARRGRCEGAVGLRRALPLADRSRAPE